jgi:hypothetical protein
MAAFHSFSLPRTRPLRRHCCRFTHRTRASRLLVLRMCTRTFSFSLLPLGNMSFFLFRRSRKRLRARATYVLIGSFYTQKCRRSPYERMTAAEITVHDLPLNIQIPLYIPNALTFPYLYSTFIPANHSIQV